jgi:hypothetical protein
LANVCFKQSVEKDLHFWSSLKANKQIKPSPSDVKEDFSKVGTRSHSVTDSCKFESCGFDVDQHTCISSSNIVASSQNTGENNNSIWKKEQSYK